MTQCQNCLTQLVGAANYCTTCGAAIVSQHQPEILPPGTGFVSGAPRVANPHHAVAHGFGKIFGLHPGVAFFTIAANLMLFGGDGLAALLTVSTGGAALPIVIFISAAAGAAVGYVTYLGQMRFNGDDQESAKIKALVTGILTAIPTRLPGILFGSVALAGLLGRGKR
jgi:hypothetical protein